MPNLSEIIDDIKELFNKFVFVDSTDVYPEMKIYINTKASWCISAEIADSREKAYDLTVEGIEEKYPDIEFEFIRR